MKSISSTLSVSVFALTLSLGACGGDQKHDPFEGVTYSKDPFALTAVKKYSSVAPNVNLGLKSYASCEELKADLDKTLSLKWLQAKAQMASVIQNQLNWRAEPISTTRSDAVQSSAAPMSSPADPVAVQESHTNVQEKGVDESDTFRIGLDQIFAISFNTLQVIDRGTLKVQGRLSLQTGSDATLYTVGHKLLVIEKVSDEQKQAGLNRSLYYEYSPAPINQKVKVSVYTTTTGAMPVLSSTQEFKGAYLDSRLIGDQLILALNDKLETVEESVKWSEFSAEAWYLNPNARSLFNDYYSQAKKPLGVRIEEGQISGIDCASISQRKVADFDTSLAKTISINIEQAKVSKAIASIGQGEEIYVTADSIYLLKSKISWFDNVYNLSSQENGVDEKVFIRQVSLAADGAIAATAEGEVQGRIKDRWALRASNAGKNLIVTTSTGTLWVQSGKHIAQNHLFVLERDEGKKSLEVISKIENFGTFEDIRAVRYVGNTVYVVTFKKTDSLFAFDLSDLKSPRLMSGLKVPGFSTYMHPLADGRLLGVGFDADDKGDFAYYAGIQVSLFDTANPLEMARIDNHIYGTRGSSSEVTSNHHAFFYNESSKLIGLPLVELSGNALKGEPTRLVFSGAQILSFENDKLVEKARITHADWMPKACRESQAQSSWWSDGRASMDIARLYQVDGRLLTLSNFGLKAYAGNDFSKAALSAKFEVPADACSFQPFYWEG